MTKLRVLVVDDQRDSVATLLEELAKFCTHEQVTFKEAEAMISDFAPHLVVLDLMLGSGGEAEAAGLGTFDYVWTKNFCPLVVYTGFPEALGDDERQSHPFIKVVKKGAESELRVIEKINEFKSHLEALDGVHREIGVVMNNALREVAPRIYGVTPLPGDAKDVLVRSARRRVAAAMDEALTDGESKTVLREWEHYLHPPLGESLLTGDIIRHKDGKKDDPTAYRVVLTPTCDLVADGGRTPKVSAVLVATCCSVTRIDKELPPDLLKSKAGAEGDAIRKAKRAVVNALLTTGHGKKCLPLPQLPLVFPTLVADLIDLELLEVKTIYTKEPTWIRIASVDSPFRELVSWAYAICAARPGLPDRDYNAWLNEMLPANPAPAAG